MPENNEKKSSKKLFMILIPVILVIAIIAIIFGVVIPGNKKAKYQDAVALMEAEEYEQARSAFLEMGEYQDAATLADECTNLQEKLETYMVAKEAYDNQNWSLALKKLNRLEGYKDAAELTKSCEDHLSYEGALADLEKGNYEEALTAFEQLGSFEEAAAKAEECRKAIEQKENYAAAKDLYEAEKYKEAKAKFEELGDYEDSGDFVQMCSMLIDYEEAEQLFADGNYETSKGLYKALLEKYDSADRTLSQRGCATPTERVETCDAEIQYAEVDKLFESGDYEKAAKKAGEINIDVMADKDHAVRLSNIKKYAKAQKYYKDGSYYDAYEAFLGADGIADSNEMAKKCIQPTPAAGEIYRNPNYGGSDCSLTIYPPTDDGNSNYIKLYTVSDELVSAIFIPSGGSGYVELPGGQYVIKVAYGSGNWFGEKDMFGDDGYYYVLNLGSGEVVELTSGYAWELTLRTEKTEGQNMGEESVPRDSF